MSLVTWDLLRPCGGKCDKKGEKRELRCGAPSGALQRNVGADLPSWRTETTNRTDLRAHTSAKPPADRLGRSGAHCRHTATPHKLAQLHCLPTACRLLADCLPTAGCWVLAGWLLGAADRLPTAADCRLLAAGGQALNGQCKRKKGKKKALWAGL